ncbi:MAG TPA: hypothetical protein PLK38_07325, partial [Methanoregulaceae archaeon]|nr:hypothetical protein [Methanoregulaceae archaeon]
MFELIIAAGGLCLDHIPCASVVSAPHDTLPSAATGNRSPYSTVERVTYDNQTETHADGICA